MIRFPFTITIDTNIFDSCKYNLSENGSLTRLERYVEEGKIKVVLSDVVLGEITNHVKRNAVEVVKKMNKTRKELYKNYSKFFVDSIALEEPLSKLELTTIEASAEATINEYVQRLQCEIMDCSNVDLKDIINNYFECNPPFEKNEKKKNEFPDAIIAAQIKKTLSDKNFALITEDKGLSVACNCIKGCTLYESLNELFDDINKNEALYKTAQEKIKELTESICYSLNDYIASNDCIEVVGTTYDRDGVISGYDYSYSEIEKINCKELIIHSIDEINDNIIFTTLACSANIDVLCYYDDYDNSPWDQETESYLYVEERIFEESHEALFPVGVEINRETNELKFSDFLVYMGSSSLIERTEIEF